MTSYSMLPPTQNLQEDDFLAHELALLRQAPEYNSSDSTDDTELFWALVVGLSKTKEISLIQAIDRVHDYLTRQAPDVRLPATLNAGPDRMKRLQQQLKAYQVDSAFQPDYTNVSADALWRTRKALLLGSVVMGGGLVINHFSAMHDHEVYPWAVFLFPMFLAVCLAGIVDPRIFWSITKHGQSMPARYKVLGVCAAGVGLAFSAFLAYYYGVWG